MRFITQLEHKQFFSRSRYLECLHLLTQKESETLQKHASGHLSKKLHCKEEEIRKKTTKEILLLSRDYWREEPYCKKISLHPNLAEIAASLVGEKSIRLGYDQYVCKGFDAFIFSQNTLQEISSLEKVLGAFLVRISGQSSSELPIPKNIGDATFFHPEFQIPWQELFQDPQSRFYLIVYVEKNARYVPNPKDLLPNACKKLGYLQGEFLKNALHPLFENLRG